MAMSCGSMLTTYWHGWAKSHVPCGHLCWLSCFSSSASPCHGTKQRLPVKSAWSISVPLEKLAKIIDQVNRVAKLAKVSIKDLQSLIGRLLWLTSARHYLRPLLIPLYRVLHQIPTTMVGRGDHVTFHLLVSKLSPSPSLTQDLTHTHQSLCRGVKLIRVANTNVLNLEDIDKLYLKSSRVWVGIQDPSSPTRTLHSESHEALQVWAHLLGSTPFTLSMAPPAHVEVTATADAMASMNLPGLGGAAFFPDGSQVWFQFQITLQQAQSLWPWVGVDMQKHIAAWELLAQFADSHCFVMRLPKCRGPITCHQGTEDAASAKACP